MENGASSNGHLTPGLSASQSPKNSAEAWAALEPLVRKSDEYAKRWKEVQSRLDIVSKAIQPKPGQPSKHYFLNTPAENAERNRLGAEMRRLMEEERILRQEQDRLAVDARTILAIPETERGKVRFIGEHLENFTPELAKAWKIAREGALIVEQYVHPDLLPEVGVHVAFHDRSSYTHRNDSGNLERTTYLTPEAGVITAAHEINHAIECQEVEVVINGQKVIVQPLYEMARKFLLGRARGVPAQKLQDLAPDGSYKPHEMAFEDDWHNKGGEHYTGRDYAHAMTEIFTMGLERMHNDPVRFFSEDPEHFAIILQLRYPIQP